MLGYTRYDTNDVARFLLVNDNLLDPLTFNGDIDHSHGYGIANIMYDHLERMTHGIELDYGIKKLKLDGTSEENFQTINKNSDAMRISFGFMFYF